MVTQPRIEQFSQPSGSRLDDELVAHHRGFTEISTLTALVPIEGAIIVSSERLVPVELLLGYLRDGRFRVRSPITVKFAAEGEHIIAEAIEVSEFGFGKNPSESLIDLQRAIAELYFVLEKEQSRLGADLQKIWETLQEKITKR